MTIISRLALAASVLLLAGGMAVPARAQITEVEKLDAARDAYRAKNYDRAFFLWLGLCQGANRGACYNLGLMYARGEGAPVDYVEAYKWIHIAAEDGLQEAIAGRARLASSMEAVEIKDAMDRAAQWKIDNGWPSAAPSR